MLEIYALTILLHYIVPARIVAGYVTDSDGKEPLRYRLNGFIVYLLFVLAFFIFTPKDIQKSYYNNFWNNFFAVNVVGILTSLYFYFVGGKEKYARCVTVDQIRSEEGKKTIKLAGTPPGELERFYLGSIWNPRIFGVDIKMLLYLIGAVGLQINILSCLVVQQENWNGDISNAMKVYLFCFCYFIIEYLLGEEVHLYTYDIFAEKIGFKLSWGCLVFYPFFYGIGVFSLVDVARDNDLTAWSCGGIVALYFIGWVLTRGANMQKFFSRKYPSQKTFLFGLISQETLPNTHILVGGWWGLSRHINYFGEILQAVALSLPGYFVGSSLYWRLLPFLYPLYYILLFVPRQIDDDKVCATKYGEKWDEYVRRVPYRIVPFVW